MRESNMYRIRWKRVLFVLLVIGLYAFIKWYRANFVFGSILWLSGLDSVVGIENLTLAFVAT